MPRGKKSKARARGKHHPVQDEAQALKDAQDTAAEKSDPPPSCADEACGDAVPRSSSDFPQKSQGMPPTTTSGNVMARRRPTKVSKGQGVENGNRGRALLSTGNLAIDIISRKTGMLLDYMLKRYKIQQALKRGEMLKIVNKRFKEQFDDIFKNATTRLECVFGLELKEVLPNGQSYMVVSKLEFQDDGSTSNELGLPNRGILIPLLSLIYLNGYCATEEEVWEFLDSLDIKKGVSHIIFGDTRKLITQDLVKENYLVYRQVAGSDPPSFEFLWGARAHTITNKVKVIEFLNNIRETIPQSDSSRYEETLKEEEEEEKAKAKAGAQDGTKVKGKGRSKAKPSHLQTK